MLMTSLLPIKETEVDRLKLKFSNEFGMKYLGHIKRIIGMNIFRTSNKFFGSEQLYLENNLKIFSMFETKIASVFLGSHIKLSSTKYPITENEKNKYEKDPLF